MSDDKATGDAAQGIPLVLRIQDHVGRGPYRPGFSSRWSDPTGPDRPPWWVEIGESVADAHKLCVGARYYGCGFRSRQQMQEWFTAKEERALDRLGYRAVVIRPSVVVAETARQIVFGCYEPLTFVMRSCRLGSRAVENLLP